MLLVKINSRLCVRNSPAILCNRQLETAITSNSNEIIPEEVEYPPIQDISYKARWRRFRETWHEEVKQVKTVEEKMIKINMPRYWGFRCMMYDEGKIVYHELPHAQFVTRTYVASDTQLPSYYDNVIEPEKLNKLCEEIKKSIEDGIVFQMSSFKQVHDKPHELINIDREIDDANGNLVSKNVNRIMLAKLSKEYPHLLNTQIDFEPRIEAFWMAGGMTPSSCVIKGMKNRGQDEILDEPIDKPLQYLGNPSLQLRHNLPLKEILPMDECENPEWEIPMHRYDSRVYGHALKRRHGVTIPGFWPGDSGEFSLMSYHKRGYLYQRPEGVDDDVNALKTQAIYANYAWLFGLASHLGFTTFNDITYPLVNQSITTNGQFWSFCVYQLNTTLVNGWHSEKNPKKNICWITEPLKLFEKIEDGKLIGFNDEVLKNLIKFYVNTPQERVGVELRPYLDSEAPRVADIIDDEKRNWLEDRYKYIMSLRPRSRLMPELYSWEIIYKFRFKTRPLDKKRTAWDFGHNPFLRRMDDHAPKYIPKALRKTKREKWEKTYYP
ncbi:hypothetical protein PV327_003843 [Microctonus hyperodae]|uniref:28S ribosomal protein S30, mitochondrial n=1 Tax=Microctonus hyperodae TaxID=165561 RepID=A0AA39L1H2_MICHY|nr:hypothetical protein PV327_003843 [Microctonus hyperodae]